MQVADVGNRSRASSEALPAALKKKSITDLKIKRKGNTEKNFQNFVKHINNLAQINFSICSSQLNSILPLNAKQRLKVSESK